MKALFLCFAAVMTSWASVATSSVKEGAAKTVVLGVMSEVPRAQFADKFQNFFKGQWQNCSACEVKNLTPYNEDGNLNRAALATALDTAVGQIQVLFLSWNEVANAQNQAWVDSLKKLSAAGVVLIGPAGEPSGSNPALSLSRTVLGQIPDAVIVGDLNEREGLLRRSFYGPEMLTALKAPRDAEVGTGQASSMFAARLAKEWNKKTQAEWISHFRARKSASRRIWPGLDEFFGR